MSADGKAPRILMSYCLSMVPDWHRALAGAIDRLAPGGILAIVDFGSFGGLPGWLADAAIAVLSRHDVTPVPRTGAGAAPACGLPQPDGAP